MRKKIIGAVVLMFAVSLLGCSNRNRELENYGEGSSSMELPVLTEEKTFDEKETITASNDRVKYEVKIDNIEFTKERNEYEMEYEDVVLVTYTYENQGEEMLLIDDVRFQLISADGTSVYAPYYFSDKLYAEPIGTGETKTAQIAFGVNDGQTSFKLVYKDQANNGDVPWTLDVVLQKY